MWMGSALDEAQPQIEVFTLAQSSQWIDITSRKEAELLRIAVSEELTVYQGKLRIQYLLNKQSMRRGEL